MKLYQDELNRIKDENKDKEATKACLRAMWPEWTMERIQDVAINNIEKYWLEQNSSYSFENTVECQLDLPICEKPSYSDASIIWLKFLSLTMLRTKISICFISITFSHNMTSSP